ncbi:MAG: tetratricopeptide repeat protein [Candidatus Helarchaeota archaeon]
MTEEVKEELGDAIKEFNRGLNAHIERSLDKALKHFHTALPTFQEFGVEDMIAGTYHELGMVFQDLGNYEEALDYYQKSLQLSEKLKYAQGCAKTLHQIGTLYEERGEVIMANEYYQRAKVFRTRRPGGLNFIIVVFIISGFLGTLLGLGGIAGVLEKFQPLFIRPEQWAQIISFASSFGVFLSIVGIMGLISAIGLLRLKGWGWVTAIITSLLTVLMISGIIFYWYLSKENIQELYDVK